MTLMEKKLRKNQRDDRRFRRFMQETVMEVSCFIGVLAWMTFLGYLFVGAIAEKWR